MELSTCLTHLESSDLVRRLREEDVAYLIKHALVQDTAQESLLKNDRKRLHRLVAEALENLYAERLDEFAARLFQHYDAAGAKGQAIVYAERAGDVAARLNARAEAILHYARAFELAQTDGENSETLIRLMTQLGRADELAVDYDAAIALYQRTRGLAQTRADRALELAAMVQLAKVWAVAAVRYEPTQAEALAREALELAREINDERAQARVLWVMMLLNLYGAGGAKQGAQYGEQSLALARKGNWREQMAFTLNDLFYTYLNLGEMARARASLLEARALWRELDDKNMLTDNLSASGMDHIVRGEFDDALAIAFESRALASRISNQWGECTSYMMEGYAHLERGEFGKAMPAFYTCIEIGDPINVRGPVLMAHYELSKAYAFLGDMERGLKFARAGLERTRSYTLGWDAWAYAVLAEVESARGDWDAVENAAREIPDEPTEYFFERFLPIGVILIVLLQARMERRRGEWDAARARLESLETRLRASELSLFLPDVLMERANLAIAQNEREAARELLNQAARIAAEMNLRATRFQIARAQFELDFGTRAAARQALEALLECVPSDLRASFLETTAARHILQND